MRKTGEQTALKLPRLLKLPMTMNLPKKQQTKLNEHVFKVASALCGEKAAPLL